MKVKRQSKVLELIRKYDIETQEELLDYLVKEGFSVTQATVSRDIRELRLTKIATSNGKQKYAVLHDASDNMSEKFVRVFKEGFVSIDMAQNILVIKTVSGMAGAVCTALDAMNIREIVGSIAGDDTIICVIRTIEETSILMKKLRKIIE